MNLETELEMKDEALQGLRELQASSLAAEEALTKARQQVDTEKSNLTMVEMELEEVKGRLQEKMQECLDRNTDQVQQASLLEASKNEVARKSEALEETEKRVAKLQSQLAIGKQKFTEQVARSKELKVQLAEAHSSVAALQFKLDEAGAKVAADSDARLEEAQKLSDSLATQLDTAKCRIAELQDALLAKSDCMQGQAEAHEKQLQETMRIAEAQKEELLQLSLEQDAMQAALEDALRRLSHEAHLHEVAMSDAEEGKALLLQENQMLQGQLASVSEAHALVQKELTVALDKEAHSQQKLGSLQSLLDNQDLELQRTVALVAEQQHELSSLRNQFDAVSQDAAGRIEAARRDILLQYDEQLASIEQALKEGLAREQKLEEQVGRLSSRVEQLQAELQQSQECLESTQTDLTNALLELGVLKQEMERQSEALAKSSNAPSNLPTLVQGYDQEPQCGTVQSEDSDAGAVDVKVSSNMEQAQIDTTEAISHHPSQDSHNDDRNSAGADHALNGKEECNKASKSSLHQSLVGGETIVSSPPDEGASDFLKQMGAVQAELEQKQESLDELLMTLEDERGRADDLQEALKAERAALALCEAKLSHAIAAQREAVEELGRSRQQLREQQGLASKIGDQQESLKTRDEELAAIQHQLKGAHIHITFLEEKLAESALAGQANYTEPDRCLTAEGGGGATHPVQGQEEYNEVAKAQESRTMELEERCGELLSKLDMQGEALDAKECLLAQLQQSMSDLSRELEKAQEANELQPRETEDDMGAIARLEQLQAEASAALENAALAEERTLKAEQLTFQLQSLLSDQQHELRALQARVKESEDHVTTLQSAVEELELAKSAAAEACEEAEGLRAAVVALQEQAHQSRGEREALQQALVEAEGMRTALLKDVQEFQDVAEKLKKAELELETVQTASAVSHGTAKRLSEQAVQLALDHSAAIQQFQQSSELVVSLQAQLGAAMQHAETADKQARQAAGELEVYRNELELKGQALEESRVALQYLQDEREGLQMEVTALEQSVHSLTSQLQEAREQVLQLQQCQSGAASRLVSASGMSAHEQEASAEQLQRLQNELAECKQTLQSLESETHGLRPLPGQLQAIQAQLADAQRVVEMAHHEAGKLHYMLSEVQGPLAPHSADIWSQVGSKVQQLLFDMETIKAQRSQLEGQAKAEQRRAAEWYAMHGTTSAASVAMAGSGAAGLLPGSAPSSQLASPVGPGMYNDKKRDDHSNRHGAGAGGSEQSGWDPESAALHGGLSTFQPMAGLLRGRGGRCSPLLLPVLGILQGLDLLSLAAYRKPLTRLVFVGYLLLLHALAIMVVI